MATNRLQLYFNEAEQDLYEHVSSQKNMTAYIKRLIRQDMMGSIAAQTQIQQPTVVVEENEAVKITEVNSQHISKSKPSDVGVEF